MGANRSRYVNNGWTFSSRPHIHRLKVSCSPTTRLSHRWESILGLPGRGDTKGGKPSLSGDGTSQWSHAWVLKPQRQPGPLALPLSNSLMSGQSLNLSGPQFPDLYGGPDSYRLRGCMKNSQIIIGKGKGPLVGKGQGGTMVSVWP